MDHTIRRNIRQAIQESCDRLSITLDPIHYENLSYEYQREMCRVDGNKFWDWDTKVLEKHAKQVEAQNAWKRIAAKDPKFLEPNTK